MTVFRSISFIVFPTVTKQKLPTKPKFFCICNFICSIVLDYFQEKKNRVFFQKPGFSDKGFLENLYLKSELNTADRVKALAAFQTHSPSRYVAARIILTATTSASRIVILDRGSNSEVEKGMAVITPDGIAVHK